ncbi:MULTISPECIES: hypothetical protein [Pseudomonas]|uniref:hypothetical protein n=1 Tax=Pseudomonas TaxID=286 RepID=UPI001BED29FA|nr:MULTISPECIES: hypothetical protein [Pseudomonas]MBT2339521.1 hypothetical protein [Pseudomonas fluorescens]MCD4528685.1 hypothetical protein [Pseudomonas sp. C3-2018]
MPIFKVRTYEENVTVEADSIEYCTDGIRLMFTTGDRITAGFSRYLWVREVKAESTAEPEAPVAEEPAVPEQAE